MACDQHATRTLGAIAADTGPDAAERYRRYAHLFRRALARLPSRGAYVNALMHMYGHFKDTIDAAERQIFLELLDAFGEGQPSFHDVAGVIAGWCKRFRYGYLADQSLLAPYPRSLVRSEQTPAGVAF